MAVHDPDRLDLSGDVPVMGCVVRGLFFVTFALGAWALLGAVGGLLFAAWEGRPVPFAGVGCACVAGLSLAIPGGFVAFTSGGKVLDRSRRQIVHTWFVLGLPVRRRTYPYAAADAVVLETFAPNPAIGVGVLRGMAPRMELFRAAGPAAARSRGRAVAAFLGLPLIDDTAGEAVRVEPEALDASFAARHPDIRSPGPRSPAAIAFEEGPDFAVMRFPAKGIGAMEVLLSGLCALLCLPVCAGVLVAGQRSADAADLLGSVGCYALSMALFLALTLVPLARFALIGAVVEVRGGALTVRHTGLSRRVRHVAGDDIHGIVHVSRAQMAATPRQRLRPGEITLRLADRDLHLGVGQPDADLAWAAAMLAWQLARTERGLTAPISPPTPR